MEKRVRYFYLRDQHKQPQACIATLLLKKDKTIAYGLSVRNPLDHFDRKIARELAAGRLALDPTEIDLSEEPLVNCHIILRRILNDLLLTDQFNAKDLNNLEQEAQEELSEDIAELDQMIKKLEHQKKELLVKRNRLQNKLQDLQGYDQIPARARKAAKRWLRENKDINTEVAAAKKAVVVSGGMPDE